MEVNFPQFQWGIDPFHNKFCVDYFGNSQQLSDKQRAAGVVDYSLGRQTKLDAFRAQLGEQM